MSSLDKLTIETPEQTQLDFPLAGIGSRFLALALDTLLQVAALWVVGIVLVAAAIPTSFVFKSSAMWALAVLIFLTFAIYVAYFALFEALWNGQTPGKRWTQLRVIKDTGRPIGAYDAILRNLLRTVDWLPTLYGAGIITMIISRENKRIGDYAAGTVVIHEKPLETVQAIWDGSAPATPGVSLGSSAELSLEELRLIEAFLERRASLDPQVRRDMARQIADRVGGRIGVPPQERPDAEKFLEAARERRRSRARFR
jgi:uncharacterized RDD family membrane protein YckC